MKRSELINIIKEKFFNKNLSESDYELILKYHLDENLGENEKIQLISLYNKIMEENQKEINRKINIDEIKKLIIFLSITPLNVENTLENIIDENILNKNLKIFKNIDEFILLYTKESSEIFEDVKRKYSGITLTGVEVDFSESHKRIENKVKKKLIGKNINKKNSIIDLTLGMKYVTVFFYKLSIENEIYAINWYTEQLTVYKTKENNLEELEITNSKFLKRLPLTVKLKIMIEPKKENANLYSEINSSAINYDFSTIKSNYKKIGNLNMELIANELGKIYSFENFITLDVDNFFETVENSLEEITKKYIVADKTGMRVKKAMEILFSLIYFDDCSFDEDDSENLENEIRNFPWKNKFLKIFSLEENKIREIAEYIFFEREKIYYNLVLNFFKRKQKDNYFTYNNFLEKLSKDIAKEIEPALLKNELEKIGDKILTDAKIEFFSPIIEDEIKSIFPKEIFLEAVTGDFYLRNSILYIEKYSTSINFNEYEELSFIKKKGFNLLINLLENPGIEISGKNLYGKLKNLSNKDIDEDKEKDSNRFRKNLNLLRAKIKDFNNNIKIILLDENIEIPDIIIYEKKENLSQTSDLQHSIKINPEIYKIV